jgi:hypothetical protein
MSNSLLPFTIVTMALLYSTSTLALTVEQFSKICDSAPGKCSDHPVVQAYVGGALDMLATLDEETDFLTKLYCKKPQELFYVPAIIHFMQTNSAGYAKRNAMVLVVRYTEENGGCPRDE